MMRNTGLGCRGAQNIFLASGDRGRDLSPDLPPPPFSHPPFPPICGEWLKGILPLENAQNETANSKLPPKPEKQCDPRPPAHTAGLGVRNWAQEPQTPGESQIPSFPKYACIRVIPHPRPQKCESKRVHGGALHTQAIGHATGIGVARILDKCQHLFFHRKFSLFCRIWIKKPVFSDFLEPHFPPLLKLFVVFVVICFFIYYYIIYFEISH